ncbi:MAG: branched-chain amino acid transport system II carrier protein [Chlamydiota bacterium]
MPAEIISVSDQIKQPPRVGTFSTGLALFSMFFGAGNLIFPLIIGRMSGTETNSAILGLGISAVIFPFLGLIAMMFYSADIHLFFKRLGKWPSLIFLFVLQMSQGPFGAMPRLVTLMHASIKTYLPGLSLGFFSILICTVIFFLTVRPQKIVHLLGVILTPLLLLTLASLIFFGAIHPPDVQPVLEGSGHYFGQGLKMGYQTTDLIAALLFAMVVWPHLSQGTDSLPPEEGKRLIRRRMTGASLIAASLLMVTYVGLCWLSAHHSWTLDPNLASEDLLQGIALKILGPIGGLVAAVAVFLACLTTAISLASVFSQYIQKDLLPNRMGNPSALLLTLGISAAIANLGFGGIVRLWGPLLEVIYPALIVLCVLNIAHSLYKFKTVQAPVFFALAVALGGLCFG